MNRLIPSFLNRNFCLIFLATLVLPAISNAETFKFKVVYANVPGSEEILAGNHEAAIEILESRIQNPEKYSFDDELATLCALYVVKGRLSAASVTCQAAVETDGSYAAYNNRGVFRAHLGDAAGAVQDFERARVPPEGRQRYIKELMGSDTRLVAGNNHDIAKEYTGMKQAPGQSLASRVNGASVEDLGNR